jgi:hypothetical protein
MSIMSRYFYIDSILTFNRCWEGYGVPVRRLAPSIPNPRYPTFFLSRGNRDFEDAECQISVTSGPLTKTVGRIVDSRVYVVIVFCSYAMPHSTTITPCILYQTKFMLFTSCTDNPAVRELELNFVMSSISHGPSITSILAPQTYVSLNTTVHESPRQWTTGPSSP